MGVFPLCYFVCLKNRHLNSLYFFAAQKKLAKSQNLTQYIKQNLSPRQRFKMFVIHSHCVR